ncbi:fatty acid--CoA ligase family protein [Mycolicibacterium farcinogenes]|uniref:class I adenylate-forming enzyme family protein n=1 Tax=Mycolicibacterium farcinogenes TaxID=1802 RepID=UPI001C8DB4E2|nr:fatty acid--CoA ligase family protein [Mycolicibacterium farcinogenes]QZH58346.1 fatty acid--CoA ligase family protein [Mycolicibacterium farcinogenes]
MSTDFADTLAAGLQGYRDRPFIEFDRKWYSGNEIAGFIEQVSSALQEAGVRSDEPVGVVVRNRVAHAATILGFIAARRPVVMIYSYQSATAIARDVEGLKLPAIVADFDDWTPELHGAVASCGSAGLVLSGRPLRVAMTATRQPGVRHDAILQESGLHLLTSGTTGPPKRIPIATNVLAHTVLSMTIGMGIEAAGPDTPPALVYWPFGSVGVCQLLAAPCSGARVVLLEKFNVPEWVRAVKTYRITRAGVQPAILRMLLQADVPREDLASLEGLAGGSGPLEPALRAEFEGRYGIPLLWAYGATEFAGSVCSWTPELHQRYGADKPDSVGRPLPGVRVRIIDPDTANEVAPGTVGVLEASVEVIGPHWVRTTDLASVDEDGFVTLHGRGDGAINRGGFKILPETVRRVLISHPSVLDACVVGVPDARLGAVPFAAVELRRDAVTPTETELKDLVRTELPSHHVPVAVAVVDALPRNAALKVRPADVAALYRP